MSLLEDDTIVAISTPIGVGGIGIVRLSGPRSVEIVDSLFVGKRRISRLPTYRLTYGRIVEDGRQLDEVLVSVMRGPHSYTTEDVVEVNCHGGLVATQMVLEAVLRKGARLAEPGEFTQRAFLGGRIDLTQAEAVCDLVGSKTQLGHNLALSQLKGQLSQTLANIKGTLRKCMSLIEVSLDFPEEDIDFVSAEQLTQSLSEVSHELQNLLSSFERGRIVREGVKAVIVGRPNVGKSSLLNLLLGEERAIVTPVPGTTRDSIEEWFQVEGIPFKIVDTAGVRKSNDVVELEGRKRTEFHIEDADLLVAVLDASQPLRREDRLLARMLEGKEILVVLNKCDLKRVLTKKQMAEIYSDAPIVEMSALKGWGVEEFKGELVGLVTSGMGNFREGVVITNQRHRDCLQRAKRAVEQACESLAAGLSFECAALDIREALEALRELVGEVTSEDILREIFSTFCIGK
ncbi:MAG: tRNA uridine-5-carboxymethylaminomethyl(34) synthesis GTPase MnmE [Candidatus Latescibacteria bacterium 4484_181]|nr:MAG: tRNA uridine-5-carboxymethylaminomethyl(34) synthesis GTPase MnmE [Candidatus Latescibacteria bacterium 4484_181]RKY67877.1 MAG: tRNA uridine-5-carboxymethylaminomethyl(34) synthesis GTPase MnmE [Candidatus Latescibacterota bacterium]RKY71463.1 MAG: tRNA uridine-5-carboxymethylaminomethyl(34) synthesis GTPase MnmE [Candidatus Latescibacterota bacterium]